MEEGQEHKIISDDLQWNESDLPLPVVCARAAEELEEENCAIRSISGQSGGSIKSGTAEEVREGHCGKSEDFDETGAVIDA